MEEDELSDCDEECDDEWNWTYPKLLLFNSSYLACD